ncbi:MAG: hypothetical protein E5V21_18600, partial [Mesorhizobium sp.]
MSAIPPPIYYKSYILRPCACSKPANCDNIHNYILFQAYGFVSMSNRKFRAGTAFFLFGISVFPYVPANAQEAGPAAPPAIQRPAGFNSNDKDFLDRFDAFRLEAGKLNPGSRDVVIPKALQEQFVDVIGRTGLSTNDNSDFFVQPDSPAVRQNDDVIAKLAETAKVRIDAKVWEDSSMQTIYGRL